MTYQIAEKFKSIQGEGVYAGTPMAFIRFVGCSVGKRICQHCDTDFDKSYPWRGGGEFTAEQLLQWAHPYDHVCLTGGEPLDQDLEPLFTFTAYWPKLGPAMFHIETSGTVAPRTLIGDPGFPWPPLWICVSPKPGFIEKVVLGADEVKVIVPGLGEINKADSHHWTVLPHNYKAHDQTGGVLKSWPTLQDALRWADAGKTVFLQPRNGKFDVDYTNLRYVQDLLVDHSNLRLSVQMHKILKVQ